MGCVEGKIPSRNGCLRGTPILGNPHMDVFMEKRMTMELWANHPLVFGPKASVIEAPTKSKRKKKRHKIIWRQIAPVLTSQLQLPYYKVYISPYPALT